MTPDDISLIRQVLPVETPFSYYPDRESPWLLAQGIDMFAKVSDLKAGKRRHLLDRPLVKPVVAASGGTVRQADLLAVAHADRALRLPEAGRGAAHALETVFAGPWQDYLLSFTDWGTGPGWQYNQLSRKGGNLVLQVGFPSDHARILGSTLGKVERWVFESCDHPVRDTGRPTLAWVRLDIDLATGDALIEEVQSDWLRYAAEEADDLETYAPRTRKARVMRDYETALRKTYAKAWPAVALLAALMLLADELGIRRIWMHTPEAGAALKGISGVHPPRSLYTSLPRRFGFRGVREAPPFLVRPRARALGLLQKREGPFFWRLDLGPDEAGHDPL